MNATNSVEEELQGLLEEEVDEAEEDLSENESGCGGLPHPDGNFADMETTVIRPSLDHQPLSATLMALTVLSALGGFTFGYDTGVVSGAMLLIEKDPDINPSTVWKELIVSSTIAFAWLFSLVGGVVSERFGRKPTILLASLIFSAGAVVMGVSGSKVTLMVGRSTVGAGIGLASMVVPIYIAESSPAHLRGILVVGNVAMITFGQAVAGCVCGGFSGITPGGWKYMLGLAGVPSAIQLIGFAFMPESPRWLISKGRIEEATTALTRIKGRQNGQDCVEREVELIRDSMARESIGADQHSTYDVIKRIVKTPGTRRALGLGCLLQFFQQIAGINTVISSRWLAFLTQ